MQISELPSLEKQAWLHLGILAVTGVAWLALLLWTHSPDVAMAAMALLAATGFPQRRMSLDERDRAISESALSVAVRAWFVLSVIVPIVSASYFGWDRTITLAVVAQSAWVAWLVVLLVRSLTTIYLYRWPKN